MSPVLRIGMNVGVQVGRGNPDRYAPRHLAHEIVAINDGGPVSPGLFSGDEAPTGDRRDRLVEEMVRKWQADGQPRTIVRVPPLRGGTSALVLKLVAAFQAAGARRVYDATGTSGECQREFLAFLRAEREAGTRTAPTSSSASSGWWRGRTGRTARASTWSACPAPYRRSRRCWAGPRARSRTATGAVPRPGQDRLLRLRRRRPRPGPAATGAQPGALLLSAFLADSQVGMEWAVDRMLAAGNLAGLQDRRGTRRPAPVPAGDGQDGPGQGPGNPIPPEYRATAQLAVAQVLEEARQRGQTMKTGEVEEAILGHPLVQVIPEEDRGEVVGKLLVEALLQQDGLGESVARAVRRRAARIGHKGAETVLMAVLQEFRDETITESRASDALRTQLHRLTGGDMQGFTKRLVQALHSPIPVADLHAALWAHYEQTGCWPSTVSGHCEALGLDFRQIDHYLRHGYRGLGSDSSLLQEVQLVATAHGVTAPDRGYDTAPLSEADVQAAIQEYFDNHADTPKKGPTRSPLGMNWGRAGPLPAERGAGPPGWLVAAEAGRPLPAGGGPSGRARPRAADLRGYSRSDPGPLHAARPPDPEDDRRGPGHRHHLVVAG